MGLFRKKDNGFKDMTQQQVPPIQPAIQQPIQQQPQQPPPVQRDPTAEMIKVLDGIIKWAEHGIAILKE